MSLAFHLIEHLSEVLNINFVIVWLTEGLEFSTNCVKRSVLAFELRMTAFFEVSSHSIHKLVHTNLFFILLSAELCDRLLKNFEDAVSEKNLMVFGNRPESFAEEEDRV